MYFALALLTQIAFEALIPIVIFVGIFVFGMTLRQFLFNRLSRWAQRSKTPADDMILAVVKEPAVIWCLMLAIYFALGVSQIPKDFIALASRALFLLGIASVTLVLANIATRLIRIYAGKLETALPITSLTQHVARIIIVSVGVLIILHHLGISITPILATFGVGGLAVALALQDTLSNLFSGFHMTVARQIKIGDFVRLETGEEGHVTDINWRTTSIQMLPNNVVLVPNAKLAQATIINYSLPDREIAVLVEVGVHYHSDLKKVERITCEVAKEVMKEISGGVATFEPVVRYHTFASSSINFTVVLRAKEFVDQYLIKHEFIKRLHERYKKEGIVIPYPIQAVNYEQEKAFEMEEKRESLSR